MKLVVTVDVEEDQWGITPPGFATACNAHRLPIVQTLFSEFGIVPTYLLTFPVVSDPRAVAILQETLGDGACEIGMHCHPWNTPPYKERISKYNSMLCNLPAALQFEKLQRLHEALQDKFEISPISFRSGRWGFDAQVARNIVRLGYRIDSSITPYTSWVRESGPDFSHISPQPYSFGLESFLDMEQPGDLAEIPVSIGYLHGGFEDCAKLTERFRTGPLRGLKLGGLLSKLHLLRKVWLSPEIETPGRMLQLVRQMKNQGYEVLNLVFHSSALMGGCGPFVRTKTDEQLFLKKLWKFLHLASEEGIVFASLSDAAKLPSASSFELKSMRALSNHRSTCCVGIRSDG